MVFLDLIMLNIRIPPSKCCYLKGKSFLGLIMVFLALSMLNIIIPHSR